MSVYFNKRRGKWCYDFWVKKERFSNYCVDPKTGEDAKNKTDAKRIEALLKADKLKTSRAEKGNDGAQFSVAEGFALYLENGSTGRHKNNQKAYTRELVSFLGASTPFSRVNEELVGKFVSFSRKQHVKIWTGGKLKPYQDKYPDGIKEEKLWKTLDRMRTDATTNRYLDAFRKTINLVKNLQDPRTQEPILPFPPRIPKLREPDHLPRPIPPEHLKLIIENAEDYVADATIISALMGFRKAEALALVRPMLDKFLKGIWLDWNGTKGKRDEFMHASKEAFDELLRLDKQAKERGVEHLITRKIVRKKKNGEKEEYYVPIERFDKSWNTALKKSGLEGLYVFHGTKASFTTALAESEEVSQTLVKDLSRHKDWRTTERYIKIASASRKKGVEAVSGRLNLSQRKSA